jgi:crossover junction endodeoxyribonuclease RusA
MEKAQLFPNSVVLPWPPNELKPNARPHWAAKAKAAKSYRNACRLLAKKAKLVAPEEGPIQVVVTFFPPDRRNRDDDNCIASFKSGRDGVADALGVDDHRFKTSSSLSQDTHKGGMVMLTVVLIDAGLADD